MTDFRSDEQREADARLHEAIDACIKAYEYGPTSCGGSLITTDYIVLTAGVEFLQDGTTKSHYNRLYPDGSMADYRALGLMEMHRVLLRADIVDREAEEGP